jgi:hypothetical protein
MKMMFVFFNNVANKIRCFNCNKTGHIAPNCPKPNKRKTPPQEKETPSPTPAAPGQTTTQMLIAAAHHNGTPSDDDLEYGLDFSFHILGRPNTIIISLLRKKWFLLSMVF